MLGNDISMSITEPSIIELLYKNHKHAVSGTFGGNFEIVALGLLHAAQSAAANNLRNMVNMIGKGPPEAIYPGKHHCIKVPDV